MTAMNALMHDPAPAPIPFREPPPATNAPAKVDPRLLRMVPMAIKAHAAAVEACDLAPDDATAEEVRVLDRARRAAFRDVNHAVPLNLHEAIVQYGYIHQVTLGETSSVSAAEIRSMIDRMLALSELPRSKKLVGELAKNGKATRAGRMYRYHSFLTQELDLVGYELYGSPDYARSFIPMDTRVRRVLDPRQTDQTRSKALHKRARLALEAVGINTTEPCSNWALTSKAGK